MKFDELPPEIKDAIRDRNANRRMPEAQAELDRFREEILKEVPPMRDTFVGGGLLVFGEEIRKEVPPKVQAIPSELWMLRNDDNGRFVPSIDDAPGGDTYLVAFTEGEAINAALHQAKEYDVPCTPVRVKGGVS